MKIVVDISEKDYLDFLLQYNNDRLDENIPFHRAKIAIANGTPLPKGHGRLIDADKLLETWYDDFCEFMTQTELESMNNIIKNAPTIIETDKDGKCPRYKEGAEE